MEERRTNKHGLGLALGVRRKKFWHFSDILCFYGCHGRILEQNPLTATRNADSSSRVGWLSFWVHWSHLLLQQPLLSDRRLSLAVANSSLFTSLGPSLSSSSSGLVGNLGRRLFVWALHQNRQRNPLTGAHPHPQNEYSLSCHTFMQKVEHLEKRLSL